MRRVRVEALAKAELRAAIAWYEDRAAGLGGDLHTSVDEALSRLRTVPDASTPVPGVPSKLGVRRVFTKRFPYSVVFFVREGVVYVVAFAHSSRRPNYWLDRIH